MRKFKVKNRKKRKYVKKQDLMSSLSNVQSLTLGIIPMLLVAIAFFATFLISNPQIAKSAENGLHVPLPQFSLPQYTFPEINFASINIPAITMPEMHFSFDIPAIQFPEIAAPQISLPEWPTFSMPEITFPDLATPILGFFIATGNAITTAFTTSVTAIVSIGNAVENSVDHLMRQLTQLTISAASVMFTAAIKLVFSTANAISVFFAFTRNITALFVFTLQVWTEQGIHALVDAWNAFVWFLGTPFRYLAHVNEELMQIFGPLFAYLGNSIKEAADGLKQGGDTLLKGTNALASPPK